jgi:hypothetical protein
MDQFKSCVAALRKEFPLILPVRVYRRDLSNSDSSGFTTLTSDDKGKPVRFIIVIHKSSISFMFHMLLHEWAHAYAWQEGKRVNDHGPEWALAMSKIYSYMTTDTVSKKHLDLRTSYNIVYQQLKDVQDSNVKAALKYLGSEIETMDLPLAWD